MSRSRARDDDDFLPAHTMDLLDEVMAEAVVAMREDLRHPDPKVAAHAARCLTQLYTAYLRHGPRPPRRTVVYVHPDPTPQLGPHVPDRPAS